MLIHQIRNATLIITYKDKKFLIDPWLMPKDYMPGFEMAVNANVRQPRVELPLSVEKIVDVDAVILTHFHPDHWDEFATKAIDKKIPFFVQSEVGQKQIQSLGFSDVRVVSVSGTEFYGITLYKTFGQHGKREIIKPLCEQVNMAYDAMGVIFKAKNEKTLYVLCFSFCFVYVYNKNTVYNLLYRKQVKVTLQILFHRFVKNLL